MESFNHINVLITQNDLLLVIHYGDTVDQFVVVKIKIAGYVPRRLSNIFTKFLTSGTINSRIAGAVIDRGYGLEIPVDYIFHGEKACLYKTIECL